MSNDVSGYPLETCPECGRRRTWVPGTEHAPHWTYKPGLGRVLVNCVGQLIGRATDAMVPPALGPHRGEAANTSDGRADAQGALVHVELPPVRARGWEAMNQRLEEILAPPAATPAPTQEVELERVTSEIAAAILEFCQMGRRFRADELRGFIQERTKAAPASPDRVLRELRKRGRLNYRVVDRHKSIYEVIPLAQQTLI